VECDLVEISNQVVIDGAVVVGHQFSKSGMTLSFVKIKKRVSIGSDAVILPGTEIGKDSQVYPLSLLFIGEKLPRFKTWIGSPIQNTAKNLISPLDNEKTDTDVSLQMEEVPKTM